MFKSGESAVLTARIASLEELVADLVHEVTALKAAALESHKPSRREPGTSASTRLGSGYCRQPRSARGFAEAGGGHGGDGARVRPG